MLAVVAVTTALFPNASAAEEPLRSYRAAAIVYDPAWGDLDGNIARIADAVDKAGAEGVGRAATESFVLSFVAILAIDFVMGMASNRLHDILWPPQGKLF